MSDRFVEKGRFVFDTHGQHHFMPGGPKLLREMNAFDHENKQLRAQVSELTLTLECLESALSNFTFCKNQAE